MRAAYYRENRLRAQRYFDLLAVVELRINVAKQEADMTRPIETVVDLLRHGEPVGGNRLRGSQDDPLSEEGWQQMRDAVAAYSQWHSITSSPLLRCREFAESLSQSLQKPLAINNDFREIGFGEWEGMTTKELMARDPKALQRYWQDPDRYAPKGAEGLTDFIARIHGAWDQLLAQQQGSHSLLVCHGGVIRAILLAVLGMPAKNIWNFDVPYANVSRVVYHRFADGSSAAQLRFHQARVEI